MMLNDPAANKAVAKKLADLERRSYQQPISYKPLFDEAITLAEEQFRRAMLAEKQQHDLKAAAEDARHALDEHLGDTDPPDGSDDPLFLACQKLSLVLNKLER